MVSYIVHALACVYICIAVMAVIFRSSASMMSILSLASIGLTIGTTVGLSSSPVIGATLTAAISLAAAWATEWLNIKAGHKPPRPWKFQLVIPICISFALGSLAGIVIRTNDLLDFGPHNLRERLQREGFDNDQINSIFDKWTEKPDHIPVNKHSGSDLLSDDGGLRQLATMYRDEPSEFVAKLDAAGDEKIKRFIGRLKTIKKTDQQIVDWFSIYFGL